MNLRDVAKDVRKPEFECSELFYTRWSPRAMSGEELSKEELLPLFEAARWAPSSYNGQPWRFIVATGEQKERFLDFLVDFNKQWCKSAAALVVVLSRNTFEYNGKPNAHHSFDTGAAWGSLALEGARRGLVVHGMAGFDVGKTKEVLLVPETYSVEMMCAIGKFADASVLPEEMAAKEKPNDRKKVSELVNFDAKFAWD